MTRDLQEKLGKLADDRHDATEFPGNYCQWVPTDDGLGIAWDQNEKFYDYVEWLQYVIDEILKPAGYELIGMVEYQGDDVDDHGYLTIEDDRVVKRTLPMVADEYDELVAFKNFVLQSDYADEIKDAWKARNA